MIRWPTVAKGGQRIAFNAIGRIYVMDSPNATPHRLTNGTDLEYAAAFSPDGQSIAYTTWTDSLGGHVMVAPYRHVDDFGDLTDKEALEIHRLAGQGIAALADVYGPQGYNLGWNLGRIAGAGVVDHIHLHVVPRWAGDTNFMPVLADVKVLPEHLSESRRRLAEAWPRLSAP